MHTFRVGTPTPVGVQRPRTQEVLTAEGPTRWHIPKGALAIAVLALVGAMVFAYPSTAAWWSQYNQSQRISSYSGVVQTLSLREQAKAIQEAQQYNAALVGGASVAAGERIPVAEGTLAPGGYEYADVLRADSSGLMARLRVPSIDVDLPIYHGTSDDTLLKGVGHLEGTALPVGGINTHSVLTAHRGLASAELFTHLDRVKLGDTFTVEVFGSVLTYRVVDTRVVEPDRTESLFPQQGRDLLTLVTCTPLGVNTHRILVTGERVTPTPVADVQQAGMVPDIPGFPWWAIGLGGTVVVLGMYVWAMGRPSAGAAAPNATSGPIPADGS